MSTLSPAKASELQPQFDALTALRDDFYKDFIADQVIEPDEQAILDRIDGKLKNLANALQGAGNVGKTISGSVGKGADNGPDDVLVVQTLLNQNGASLAEDGIIGPKTRAAITAFQEQALGFGDCYVEPGGKTMRALNGGAVQTPEADEGTSETGGGGVPETGGGGSVGGDEGTQAGGSESGGTGTDTGTEPEALPVAEAIEEAARNGDPSQPIVIDQDPSDPEVAKKIVEETNKHLPDQQISVKQPTDADGNALILDTLKGIGFKGAEVSVGMSVGPYGGTLKLKLSEEGQVEAAVEIDIVESIAIGGGSHGIFVTGEFKPLSAEFNFSTVGENLEVTCELSTSGSIIAGIGAAADASWAGLGKQMELKVSQSQKMKATLSISELIDSAKEGAVVTPQDLIFSVPCTIAFKGEEALILGASGDGKAVSAAAAAKLTLEKWDPILGLEVTSSGVTVLYKDLTKFLAYQAANALPMLKTLIEAYETSQEIRKFLENPSGYAKERREEAEQYLKFIMALPEVGQEIIARESRELEAVINELERQYEDSKKQVTEAVDDMRKEAEALLGELEKAGQDIGELAGGAYDDLMNEIEEAQETAGKAIDEAVEDFEKGRQAAEQKLKEIRQKIADAKKEARDLLGEAAEGVEEALDEGREMAEELVDDLQDAVQELKEKAGEELAETAEEVLEFAELVGEVVGDVGKDLIKQVNEGRKAAEEAKKRAFEELRETGEEIMEAVQDLGEDAVEKAQEALEVADEAREKVEETVEDVWDLVQEATKAAAEKAKGVKDGIQDLAGDAVDELFDLGGEVWDFAEDLSDAAKDKLKSVAEDAKQAAEAAKEQLEDAYHDVEKQVGEYGEDIKEGAEEAIEYLDETRKGVLETVDKMAEAAKKKAEAAKKQMEDMAEGAKDFAEGAQDAIEDTASDLLDQFDTAFDTATEKAGDYAKEAMKKAEEARKLAEAKAKQAQEALDKAAEMAMEQAKKAKEELEKKGKGLLDKAEDAFDDVKDAAGGAADKAKGLLGKLGSLF